MLASAATMYSTDGRSIKVDDSEIKKYEAVGWYWGKPTEISAFTGLSFNNSVFRWYDPLTGEEKYFKTATVGEKRVSKYEAKGWSTKKFAKMYSADGRTITVNANEIEDYENVGWYWGKPVTVYSLDGES